MRRVFEYASTADLWEYLALGANRSKADRQLNAAIRKELRGR